MILGSYIKITESGEYAKLEYKCTAHLAVLRVQKNFKSVI